MAKMLTKCDFFKMLIHILTFLNAFLIMNLLFFIKLHLVLCLDDNVNQELCFWAMVVLFIMIIFGCIGFIFSIPREKIRPMEVKVIGINNKTGDYFLGYFSLFVLLFLSFNFNTLDNVIVFFLIMLVLCVVYCRNDLFYINPTITCFGYKIYKIDYEFENIAKSALCIGKEKIYIGDKIIVYTVSGDCSLYIKEGKHNETRNTK